MVIMICSVMCCNVRSLKVIKNKLCVWDSTGEMRECHMISVSMCSLHLVLHCTHRNIWYRDILQWLCSDTIVS